MRYPDLTLTLIIVGIMFVLGGCVTKTAPVVDSNGIAHINLVNSHELESSIDVKEFGNVVKYVPLEYKDKCALSNIIKVRPTKSSFFIMTPQGLYRFGRDGKYLTTIGKKGNGPGEYNLFVDFCVDEKQQMVYGLDMMVKKIRKYSYDGSYVEDYPLSPFCFQLFKLSKDRFAVQPIDYNGDRECKMVVINTKGDTLKKFANSILFTRVGSPIMINHQYSYKHYKNQVRFYQIFNDTIYNINKEIDLQPLYVMDCGKQKMPLKILTDGMKLIDEGGKYYLVRKYLETDHQLFIDYNYNKQLHHVVYSKDDGSVRHLGRRDSLGIKNTLDNGLPFWPETIYNDNEMIGMWTAVKLRAHLDHMKSLKQEIPDALKTIDKTLTINDNPVLQIVTL